MARIVENCRTQVVEKGTSYLADDKKSYFSEAGGKADAIGRRGGSGQR